ncbi:hypothetical protein BC832DRAFT_558802, partial [Gaertneriomyces semiglobifer]
MIVQLSKCPSSFHQGGTCVLISTIVVLDFGDSLCNSLLNCLSIRSGDIISSYVVLRIWAQPRQVAVYSADKTYIYPCHFHFAKCNRNPKYFRPNRNRLHLSRMFAYWREYLWELMLGTWRSTSTRSEHASSQITCHSFGFIGHSPMAGCLPAGVASSKN